jgi:CheY-like chemotaxis protein
VLEQNDFDVVAASGVNEALQRMGAERFDVLLTDLHNARPWRRTDRG